MTSMPMAINIERRPRRFTRTPCHWSRSPATALAVSWETGRPSWPDSHGPG
jgi:hypothetical protein